jgi:heptosyltransferase-2
LTLPTPKHILVARTDKIGDLLLSLPVFQALKKAFPRTRVTALVSSYTQELVRDHPAIDRVATVEKTDGVFKLAGRLKEIAPDTFLILYPRPKVVLAAWLAGIPVRIGSAYRWYSPFLNQKVPLHRSSNDRHEAEYNLEMLKPLGVISADKKIELPLSKSERDFAGDFLKEKGLKSKTRFVVVHPGHRGSALNWKPERYAQLVERLCKTKGLRIVLTGGAEETAIIARVTANLPGLSPDQKPVLIIGELGLKQLAAVYENALCFVSGSTGTMHLAAAVGTPTVSLFSPAPETTAVRWGPWGNESTVLVPKGLTCEACKIGYCERHDPMDGIDVSDVLEAVRKHLPRAKTK